MCEGVNTVEYFHLFHFPVSTYQKKKKEKKRNLSPDFSIIFIQESIFLEWPPSHKSSPNLPLPTYHLCTKWQKKTLYFRTSFFALRTFCDTCYIFYLLFINRMFLLALQYYKLLISLSQPNIPTHCFNYRGYSVHISEIYLNHDYH